MTNKTSPLSKTKKEHPIEKVRLHKRNKHRSRYDFPALLVTFPALKSFVSANKFGDSSIDFGDPAAVKALNTALLMHYYDMVHWDIPQGYLCPPIPGRADYIHYIADVLSQKFFGKIPTGSGIKCLDIGVGANCVYPIIGNKEYGWSFIGTDIDAVSIDAANKIIYNNPTLKNILELRLQPKSQNIFKNIILDDEKIDLTICNPPFHASHQEAQAATLRKLKNLNLLESERPTLNFGGKSNELWCDGGEERFLNIMIAESKLYAQSCFWFTTLVSKQSNLKRAIAKLSEVGVQEYKTIPMGQGNKTSRILAWTFLSLEQQRVWSKNRWAIENV